VSAMTFVFIVVASVLALQENFVKRLRRMSKDLGEDFDAVN
jgi:hypothetical protein